MYPANQSPSSSVRLSRVGLRGLLFFKGRCRPSSLRFIRGFVLRSIPPSILSEADWRWWLEGRQSSGRRVLRVSICHLGPRHTTSASPLPLSLFPSYTPQSLSLPLSLGLRSLGPRLNGIFSHFFVSFLSLEVDHVWTETLLLLGAIHTTLFTQTLLAEISRVFLEVATFSLMCCSCVGNKVTYGFSFLTWPPHSGGQSSVDMSHLSPSKWTKTCR